MSARKKIKQKFSRSVAGKTGQKKSGLFPIVAIGASAGGLEAVTELLKNLSPDTGMAYVYIQHLDPTHESVLATILSKATKMKVLEARDKMRLERNHVYIIPPGKDMSISDSTLRLETRAAKPELHLPVNRFFISLAEKRKQGAIGIVLSGNASDGTQGLKAIKIAGGITFAQDSSAKFQGMPKAAIAEGAVDFILTPKEIASELEHLNKQKGTLEKMMSDRKRLSAETSAEDISAILVLLKKSTGVDFSYYKPTTIHRRIVRRMLLYKLSTLGEYARYLKQHVNEINILYQDLLINVTSFFRDPAAMEYLRKVLFPRIIKNKSPNDPLRIWVPACSTGQEAYSLAILLMEVLGEKVQNTAIQIFATDLSDAAITKARIGIYTKADLAEVSPKRLQRFFTKADSGSRINKSIRDLCVFAPHNIFKDPPFSRLDFISCCNLLIYLEPVLQKKAIATFHYALNQNGCLMLGKSETTGSSQNLFAPLEKKLRIYVRKKDATGRGPYEMAYRVPEREDRRHHSALIQKRGVEKSPEETQVADIEKTVDGILLSRYIPASVVVNSDYEILHFRGSTGLFLEPAPGKASLNLLKMAKPGMGFELRNAVTKASKTGKPQRKTGIEIKMDGESKLVNIEVVPLKPEIDDKHYLVIFRERETVVPHLLLGTTPAKNKRVKQLEAELMAAREDMRVIIEGQEAVNEELQSANEEVVSSNEELQSINEELETSKEEVESTNEELVTINNELQMRNEQLSEAYDYGDAIISTIRESLLVLDKDLRVKSANRSFYKTFKATEEQTEGRLIYDLGSGQWDIPKLRELLEDVIPHNSQFFGFEVRNVFPEVGEKIMVLNGRKIIQRVSKEALILLAIEDITEPTVAHRIISEREAWFRNMADNSPVMIWVAGTDKLCNYFNTTWLEFTGRTMEQEIGNGWADGVHKDDLERCLKIYVEAFDRREPFKMEYRLRRHDGEYRWILDVGKPTYSSAGNFTGYVGSCTEIHDQREINEELEKRVNERTAKLLELNTHLELVNSELQQYSYVASHDLQEPLRKIITFSDLAQEKAKDMPDEVRSYLAKIIASCMRMKLLIEDLLNFSRVDALKEEFVKTDLNDVMKAVLKDFDLDIVQKKARVNANHLPVVEAVPVQMGQLLRNIISNALKFTKENKPPVVDIVSRQLSEKDLKKLPKLNNHNSYYEIVVKDNGIGFGKDDAEQIFTIFQRLHNKEKYPGTGIGLALCRKIVNNHGGKIFAEAEENKGAAFHIILPVKH